MTSPPLKSANDAGAVLYHQHATSLLSYVRTRIGSLQLAEDIVVETFLAALESEMIARLAPSEQVAWLRRVAHNKIIDTYRQAQRRPDVALDSVADALITEMATPEQAAVRNEEIAALRAAVASLSTIQQTILRLRFVEGQRCPEIALALGKREDAVRKMLLRTLNQLRITYTSH